MTNNTQIKVHVDVAKLNIVLEAWVNGAPTGSVTLSAADTDSLIRELGKNRAQLVQPVAADLDEAAIDPVIDPAWQTPEVRYQEGRMLSIRDPGLRLADLYLPGSGSRGRCHMDDKRFAASAGLICAMTAYLRSR